MYSWRSGVVRQRNHLRTISVQQCRAKMVTMTRNPTWSTQVSDAFTAASILAFKLVKNSRQIDHFVWIQQCCWTNLSLQQASDLSTFTYMMAQWSFISYRCWIDSSVRQANDFSTFTYMMAHEDPSFNICVANLMSDWFTCSCFRIVTQSHIYL